MCCSWSKDFRQWDTKNTWSPPYQSINPHINIVFAMNFSIRQYVEDFWLKIKEYVFRVDRMPNVYWQTKMLAHIHIRTLSHTWARNCRSNDPSFSFKMYVTTLSNLSDQKENKIQINLTLITTRWTQFIISYFGFWLKLFLTTKIAFFWKKMVLLIEIDFIYKWFYQIAF